MPQGHQPDDSAHRFLDRLFAAARQQVFPNGCGEEGFQSGITERFRKGFALPWGVVVWKDILSGSWGLGRTKQQVAKRLGLDVRGIFTGLQVGTLTTQILVIALAAARRDPGYLPGVQPLRREMVRSGHIDAIEYARAKWRGLDVRRPPPLDPWDYELLFLILHARLNHWYPHHLRFRVNGERADPGYHQFAATLASEVLALPELFPSHCDLTERARGQGRLRKLANPENEPAKDLEGLVRDWQTPWVLAFSNLHQVPPDLSPL